MPRKIQRIAKRGSQKWLQKTINKFPKLINSLLSQQIGLQSTDQITWLSPLEDDQYAEYQDQAFLNCLNIKLKKVPLLEFWPSGGPVWDGLGRSRSENIFLVEAKAHISELVSSPTEAASNSLNKIQYSLKQTKQFLNGKNNIDWSQDFYQYTNRLAHLYLLRELNSIPVFLIFIYFVNDNDTNGPQSVEEWIGAIKLLHAYLGIGRTKLSPYIKNIFIDITQLK